MRASHQAVAPVLYDLERQRLRRDHTHVSATRAVRRRHGCVVVARSRWGPLRSRSRSCTCQGEQGPCEWSARCDHSLPSHVREATTMVHRAKLEPLVRKQPSRSFGCLLAVQTAVGPGCSPTRAPRTRRAGPDSCGAACRSATSSLHRPHRLRARLGTRGDGLVGRAALSATRAAARDCGTADARSPAAARSCGGPRRRQLIVSGIPAPDALPRHGGTTRCRAAMYYRTTTAGWPQSARLATWQPCGARPQSVDAAAVELAARHIERPVFHVEPGRTLPAPRTIRGPAPRYTRGRTPTSAAGTSMHARSRCPSLPRADYAPTLGRLHCSTNPQCGRRSRCFT